MRLKTYYNIATVGHCSTQAPTSEINEERENRKGKEGGFINAAMASGQAKAEYGK